VSERLEAALAQYGEFRKQWYATPLLLTIIFVVLALLPFIRGLAFLGIAPLAWLSLNMLIVTLVWASTAQAWNIMSGYTGQFSFGHAAFFGLGAYGTIIAVSEFAISPWIGMAIGSIVAGIFGFFIGVVSFRYRLKGHYFALATLAFAELLRFLFNNIDAIGGASGYIRPLPFEYADDYGLAAFQFTSDLPYYYIILTFLLVITVFSFIIKRSKLGLYFFAIREEERAAAAIGIPTYRYKLIGVTISAGLTAWAGAFWAMYFETIRPETVFDILVNVEILLPAIVGGIGTVIGPIVGSFIVTPIAEFARQSVDLHGLNNIIYGLILVAIVLYSPKGVVSWPSRIIKLLRERTGILGRSPSNQRATDDD